MQPVGFRSILAASCDTCYWSQTLMCIALLIKGECVSFLRDLHRNNHMNAADTSTSPHKAPHGAVRQTRQLLSMHRKLQTPDHEPSQRTIVLFKTMTSSPVSECRSARSQEMATDHHGSLRRHWTQQGGFSNVSSFVVGVLSTRLWRWRRSLRKEARPF